jgi:release factor glutamine methyltransferase
MSFAAVSQSATLRSDTELTLRTGIAEGARFLSSAGLENGRLDAEVLLSHALGVDKTALYMNIDAPLHPQDEGRYRDMLSRRVQREPVAYITGRKEFWSLDFLVTPDVLIPRPETELLVEIAVGRLKVCDGKSPVKILDLGTGTGAIAVALAKELPDARIAAVDISSAALAVARQNSESHGVADRISFLSGDLFQSVRGQFDLIVSNPPYVRREELSALPPEIREWEPVGALDGGIDGLDFYRRIIAESRQHLRSGGSIILEIGADMGGAVAELVTRAACYAAAVVYQDYAARDRVIAATKTPQLMSTVKGLARG